MVIRFKKAYIAVILIAVIALLSSSKSIPTFSNSAPDNELVILMYHHITDSPSLVGKYTIHRDELEKDFQYLKDHGYNTISTKQLINHFKFGEPLPDKPVMITFDDGQESFYVYAYPLLKKYNMCAVMSIVGAYTDKYTELNDHNVKYSSLNWQEVKELNDSGIVEIQHHSYDMHSYDAERRGVQKKKGESADTYKAIFSADILKLQQELNKYTGREANVFAFPFGYSCEEAVEVLKENGFEAAFTCEEKKVNLNDGESVLFSLGRFNRSGLETSENFMASVL